ncbi:MAG TPA: hypothetical protein VE826_14075 [Dongiaceae bacterium]|nr:hypothetical protein [Dongiaceae bacterium]
MRLVRMRLVRACAVRSRCVRTLTAALLLAAAAVAQSAPAGAAPGGFSDVICPGATQYVMAAGKLRIDDAPERIYEAAQAAADAYTRCSKEKLSDGFREAQHYADTRSSSFGVVAARALIAMNRLDEARRELVRSRTIAQQVVDWHMETEAYQSADVNGTAVTIPGDNRRRSMYRQSAQEIVASADQALEEVERRAALSRRQASPPAPAPTPAH